jgi:hypothetical protein
MMRTRRFDVLLLLGAVVALVDTACGTIASMILDFRQPNEILLAISFVLGAAMYAADVWLNRHVAICLLALWLLRWTALCFIARPPVFANPWHGSQFLIAALVLLQLSKLRRLGAHRFA